MAEKSLNEKVQQCEKLDSLPIPLDILGKKFAGCSNPDVQAELAKKKQNQNLVKGGSEALKGTDPRSVALKEAANS